MIGIDDSKRNPESDGTDHFIVIMGRGSDSQGGYFNFWDNRFTKSSDVTNPNHKLRFSKNQLRGYSFYKNEPHLYIVTKLHKYKQESNNGSKIAKNKVEKD
jgi:hypothetical protein